MLYENFYKTYNPKAAARLGIVYTPNEIVRFMIESVDHLTHKHFGKLLADKGVEILDPATGTGTFVTELIEYLPKDKLEYKYKHEIHCNEVAILPYYIANLNVEYTYKQKMGKYQNFEHICFVDTLDHTSFDYKQTNIFAMTVENTERIRQQNERTISVIIGNPPYFANQANENDENSSRTYFSIDKLIKQTYIKQSKRRRTKRYDMYSRFFRWATNRLEQDGILAFITNSNFLNSTEADGFRKVIAQEFSYIYIIDLGGDVRANPKLSGNRNNVFGIQAGVAISFMVKKSSQNTPCKIYYSRRPEFETSNEKLKFLSQNKFEQISFTHIQPDSQNNWMDFGESEFKDLVAIANQETKQTKTTDKESAIFKTFSFGTSTNRDEWVYEYNLDELKQKIKFMIEVYNQSVKDSETKNIKSPEKFDKQIKWSDGLKTKLLRRIKASFGLQFIKEIYYRPFIKFFYYADPLFSDRLTSLHNKLFGAELDKKNPTICLTMNKQVSFVVQATNCLFDAGVGSRGSQGVSLYRYDKNGNRIDNITDWGLDQFQTHYKDSKITKLDIFHYTYAVLHDPVYRQKYELNLKQEFPRLPFYNNFYQWAEWGQQLMDLHINYENVEPYPLERIDLPWSKNSRSSPKAKLKSDKSNDSIIIDEVTTLTGIPKTAWEYLLGNRCALDWILDQYKESTPEDPTVAEKFNRYRLVFVELHYFSPD
ncbi:MAG: N-6 DNA methylase [Rhizonema sp. PD38]|nr:N-6 DNA methylase [Rhizonema sp. PD38]